MSKITIIGAGLVGSTAGIILTNRGHQVVLYEKNGSPGEVQTEKRRSINLAISERGWYTLNMLGIGNKVRDAAVPMYGRMIHHKDGNTAFQPYGTASQCIYSVSRDTLNNHLLELVASLKIPVSYGHECLDVNINDASVYIRNKNNNAEFTVNADLVIGADGASSSVRNSAYFNHELQYIDYGYKELVITDDTMDQHALHIWPRKQFMLIALPNANGSFTCTLFLPYAQEPSFQSLKTKQDVQVFFEEHFPDILAIDPNIVQQYMNNKDYRLYTVKCSPWHYKDKVLLIGDAAHGILPFYGQGANAGFEDCVVLNQLLDIFNEDWLQTIIEYQRIRVPDTDAIAQLSIQNFIEMRDKVADPLFLMKKEIDAYINKNYPGQWTSLYTMVSFSRVPYAEAYRIALKQDRILENILSIKDIGSHWETLDFQSILSNGIS